MPTMTVIEVVQDIMNDIESDEVNSISDTEESTMIAHMVKSTFYELIGRRDWPHLSKFTTMISVGESARPTHLNTPSNMSRLEWIKYNRKSSTDTRNKYEDIAYLTPEQFIAKTNSRDLSQSNVVEATDFGGAKLQILNDKAPQWYTSFDDQYIVMDSYDSAVESTLQASNTQARIYAEPSWTMEDNFVPDLPPEVFPAFLAECKSVVSYRMDGEMDEKAEQQSTRQQKRLSAQGWSVNGGIRYPDYGRKGGRVTSGTHFNRTQRS